MTCMLLQMAPRSTSQKNYSLTTKFVSICVVALIHGINIHGGELKTVSASYTFYASEQMSVEQAKIAALDRAMAEALSKEFGMMITQSTATATADTNDSEQTSFITTGQIDVKGEWIETIGEPRFDITFSKGLFTVRVDVKGKARAIDFTKPTFSIQTICNDAPSTEFHDGDAMYLDLEAPSSGFVAAYLLSPTEGNAYRLLPYTLAPNSPMAVEGGKTYRFFSRQASSTPALVDEVELTATNLLDLNDLCVLYSPKEFKLPTPFIGNGYELQQLALKDFHHWLATSRTHNTDLQSKIIHITIKNLKQ